MRRKTDSTRSLICSTAAISTKRVSNLRRRAVRARRRNRSTRRILRMPGAVTLSSDSSTKTTSSKGIADGRSIHIHPQKYFFAMVGRWTTQ